jgi:hypothetical protein
MTDKEVELEIERQNIASKHEDEDDTPLPTMYKEEIIGRLEGIEILNDAQKFREILIHDLEPSVSELIALDEDLLTYGELKRWAKWISGKRLIIDTLDVAR